jgi:hypothetical protein
MLLKSSKTCFFCELIRIALIIELKSTELSTRKFSVTDLLSFLGDTSQNNVFSREYSEASIEIGLIGRIQSSSLDGSKKFFLEWIECVTYDDHAGMEPPIRTGLAVYSSNGTYAWFLREAIASNRDCRKQSIL